jgi:hypothetical protein
MKAMYLWRQQLWSWGSGRHRRSCPQDCLYLGNLLASVSYHPKEGAKTMFCNRCGTELQADFAVCPNCGKRIGDPVSAVAQTRLQRHLHILGTLWIALGILFAIPAAGLFIFGSSAHFILHRQGQLAGIFPLLLYLAGGTLLILAAGGICVGLGLIERAPWARIVAIILGVLALFHPPFGTALGIYTLWVFLADENGSEYQYLARSS